MLKVDRSSGPLFCLRLSVSGSTGGKSGFRRIHAHLQRLLVNGALKLGHDVPNLHFAGVDPLAIGGLIHRFSHLGHRLLKFPVQLLDELLWRQLNLPIHGQSPTEPTPGSDKQHPLNIWYYNPKPQPPENLGKPLRLLALSRNTGRGMYAAIIRRSHLE